MKKILFGTFIIFFVLVTPLGIKAFNKDLSELWEEFNA